MSGVAYSKIFQSISEVLGNIDFFDPHFKLFLEVFLFDSVAIIALNTSDVTMCLPSIQLRMVLRLNLDDFIESLKKSKSISGFLGWVLELALTPQCHMYLGLSKLVDVVTSLNHTDSQSCNADRCSYMFM